MKAFIPLLPLIIKDENEQLKVGVLKAIGVFGSLAAVVPVRVQNFYKEINDNGLLVEICEILKSFDANLPKNVTAIHQLAFQVLSTLNCPVYGDFYSFPWKRGPHDNILDYSEAKHHFENVRGKTKKAFATDRNVNFAQICFAIFQREDEKTNVEVKSSVLRMICQLLHEHDTDAAS